MTHAAATRATTRATRRPAILLACCLVAAVAAILARPADAQGPPAPRQLDANPTPSIPEVRLDDPRGRTLPRGLAFVDENGNDVTLGDYLDGERPVVLQLGYYRCPMLCGQVMNGMNTSFNDVSLKLGEDYRVVSISIDPRESPTLARAKQQSYAANAQDAAGLTAGWAMLTSPDESQVRELARELGFGYRYVEQTDVYGHAAAVYILSPDGVVTRMLTGTVYPAQTVQMSLMDAADGKVGSALDKVILTCFRWDQATGRYTPFAFGLLRAGAAIFLLIAGGVLVALLLAERSGSARRAQRERVQRLREQAATTLDPVNTNTDPTPEPDHSDPTPHQPA